MLILAKRNLKLFFRDHSAVFFSFLSAIIIIVLYAVFLNGTLTEPLEDRAVKGADALISSWLMAGVLSVATMSTTMGAFNQMVFDRKRKIVKDFYSSPIARWKVTGGYLSGAIGAGFLLSLATLIMAELYIAAHGGGLLSAGSALKIVGVLALSVLASSSMVLFLVSFFSSEGAFSAVSSILGTLIGFLTGIFLPIGDLPDSVQWAVKVFPVSHAASLLRKILMESSIRDSFGGTPAEAVQQFETHMGVVYQFGSSDVSSLQSIWILVFTAVLFFGLSALNFSRKAKS